MPKNKGLPLSTDAQPRTNHAAPKSTSPVKVVPGDRLKSLIRLVLETAEAKGWDADVAAEDKKTFNYATVAVSRTAPGTSTEITGTFEITCDEKVRVTYHPTSFHSYGLKDLYDAIGNEFWKLPWIKQNEEKGKNKSLPFYPIMTVE